MVSTVNELIFFNHWLYIPFQYNYWPFVCRSLKLKVCWNQSFPPKNFQVHIIWDGFFLWYTWVLVNNVHIYILKIIFWMADMLLFMVTEVHILSFMNTILITEELYICLFKSFYKFGFFFLLFCYFICFICLILPLYSLCAWNLQKEPGINSRIWSEAHEEIACSFLLWFTNRWRSN